MCERRKVYDGMYWDFDTHRIELENVSTKILEMHSSMKLAQYVEQM